MPKLNYTKVNWQDAPSTETPINADNLDRMDNALWSLYDDVDKIEQELAERDVGDVSENIVTFDEDTSQVINLQPSGHTLHDIFSGFYNRVSYLLSYVQTLATKVALDNAIANFARLETSTTATKDYTAGDYLVYQGQLYRVTTAVNQGDDFAESITATTAGDEIRAINSGSDANQSSYRGMIIHSTTLVTMEDVIREYGGTTWLLHNGYFLRGASQDVTPNSAQADAGADTHNHGGNTGGTKLTAAQCAMPSHSHGPSNASKRFQLRPNDTQSADSASALGGSGYYFPRTKTTGWEMSAATAAASKANADSAHSHTISSVSNVPAYKRVYIWERTE